MNDTSQKVQTVGLLIPAYNEAPYLPDLFLDILKQSYPHQYIEILFADGMSQDCTRELLDAFAKEHAAGFRRITVLCNENRNQPAGWNTCIRAAGTDVVIRIDAHSRLPEDFIEKQMACQNLGEMITGGVCTRIVKDPTPRNRTLLLAENAMFGSGISSSRRSRGEKTRYVKTLSHTAYRRELFETCGLFDERFLRTEDNEMHYRLRKAGYRLYQDTEIRTQVYIRTGLKEMIRQKFSNGYWIGATVKHCPGCLSLYHFAPAALVAGLVITTVLACIGMPVFLKILLCAYAAFAVAGTFAEAVKLQFTPWFLLTPFLFAGMHLVYGIGTWVGLLTGKIRKDNRNGKNTVSGRDQASPTGQSGNADVF